MSDKKDLFTVLSEVLTTLKNLDEDQDQSAIQEVLLATGTKLNEICKHIDDMQSKIASETNKIAEANVLVERQKKMLEHKLDKIKQQNKDRAEKYAAILDAQDKEYEKKVAELEAIEKDYEKQKQTLMAKQATHAEHRKQLNEEIRQQAKYKKILNLYGTRHETGTSKFLDGQRALQSESTRLDEILNQRQMEIEKLRVQNAAKMKKLSSVKMENSSKSDELIALRAETDKIREQCKRINKTHLKVVSKFEAAEGQRNAELEVMIQQLAEEQAKYENAKKMNTEVIDRINADFENDKIEQMTTAGQSELKALNDHRSELEESLGAVCKLMDANKLKLAQINEAKEDILDRLDRTMNTSVDSSSHQDHQLRLPLSERGSSVETEHLEREETFFLLPHSRNPNRHHEQMPMQEGQQQEQAGSVVSSADSSLTEFGETTLQTQVEDLNEPKDVHNRMKMFRDNYL